MQCGLLWLFVLFFVLIDGIFRAVGSRTAHGLDPAADFVSLGEAACEVVKVERCWTNVRCIGCEETDGIGGAYRCDNRFATTFTAPDVNGSLEERPEQDLHVATRCCVHDACQDIPTPSNDSDTHAAQLAEVLSAL